MQSQTEPTQDHQAAPQPPSAGVPEPKSTHPQEVAATQQLEHVEEQMTGFERATLRWARAAVILSGIAAVFVCLQWMEMRSSGTDTHSLAVAARNQATWTQNLASAMKIQAERTKDLADRMNEQAEQTKIIATQAVVQANAAKSAGETAKEALHISERAYLTLGFPVNDFQNDRIEVAILNGGHIPSGPVTIIVHEATFAIKNITENFIPLSDLIEAHWQTLADSSIPVVQNGSIYQVEIHFPKLVQADLNAGKQAITALVVMTYNDGFPGTHDQSWTFCDRSTFAATQKLLTMRPCDPNQIMRTLLTADHYLDARYEQK